jgi:hypothetical protein
MTGVSPTEVVCAVDGFLGEMGSRSKARLLPVVES